MHRNVRLGSPSSLRPSIPAGRSVIAVVGIDHYAAWPRLHNAVNDARGAARLFTQLGFVEVTEPLLDGAATGEAMRRLVTTDLAQLAPEDSLVVFFAGHGHTDTAAFDDVSVKTGYVIPVDAADPDGHEGVTWLRLDSWLSDIARLPPRHILVMIDACHSGVALSSLHKWREQAASPRGELDALRVRRSRCVITSALDDQRAMDGGPYPGHSLFTGCLIEGLSGGLAEGGQYLATGREIGQYLQKRVRSYPHTTQTPDFGAFELDDRGDIVVPILGSDAALAAAEPLIPATELDLASTESAARVSRVRQASTDTGFAGESQVPSRQVRSPRRLRVIVAGTVGIAVGIAVAGILVGSAVIGNGIPHENPETRDVSLEVPAIEVKGMVLEPHAIRQPWVPLVKWPPYALEVDALEKQRGLVKRTKDPVQKQAHAIVLAAMLYREVNPIFQTLGTLGTEKKALLTEAHRILREVVQQAGDKAVDENTLRLLGTCDLIFEDYPAAEKTWQVLVKTYPTSKDEPSHRAWLAYALLKQFKNAAALAAVEAEKLDDKQPELAYIAAWARWRNHDDTGAWQAITAAAKRWGEAEYPCGDGRHSCIFQAYYTEREALERDVRLLAGHANISLDQAMAVLTVLVPDRSDRYGRWQRYEQLRDLGLRYGRAGRWVDGVAALDKAVEIVGDDIPPHDRVAIRRAQADFTGRLDTPDVVAKYAAQAIDAFPRCDTSESVNPSLPTPWGPVAGSPDNELNTFILRTQQREALDAQRLKSAQREECLKVKADTVQQLYTIGQLFYKLYETANDLRYYQPTYDLYAMTIPLLGNGATRAQAAKEMRNVETTRRSPKVGTGIPDGAVLRELIGRHNEEIETCYESSLGTNPVLGGTLTLDLASDASGAITGAAAQPAVGAADLAAVAGCIALQARQWKLPRGTPGNMHIKLSYALSVKKAQK